MKLIKPLSIIGLLFSLVFTGGNVFSVTVEEMKQTIEKSIQENSKFFALDKCEFPKNQEELKIIANVIDTVNEILKQKPSREMQIWALEQKTRGIVTLVRARRADLLMVKKYQEDIDAIPEMAGLARLLRFYVLNNSISANLNPMTLSGDDLITLAEECADFVNGNPGKASEGLSILLVQNLSKILMNYPDLDTKKLVEPTEKIAEFFKSRGMGSLQKSALALARRMNLKGEVLNLKGFTADEKPFDMSDYKGKVVLVEYWFTNCIHCATFRGKLIPIHTKYQQFGFEVVAVSIYKEDSHKQLKKYINDPKTVIPWPVVSESFGKEHGIEASSDTYGINSAPQLMLVDREGKVITAFATINATVLDNEIRQRLTVKRDPMTLPKVGTPTRKTEFDLGL